MLLLYYCSYYCSYCYYCYCYSCCCCRACGLSFHQVVGEGRGPMGVSLCWFGCSLDALQEPLSVLHSFNSKRRSMVLVSALMPCNGLSKSIVEAHFSGFRALKAFAKPVLAHQKLTLQGTAEEAIGNAAKQMGTCHACKVLVKPTTFGATEVVGATAADCWRMTSGLGEKATKSHLLLIRARAASLKAFTCDCWGHAKSQLKGRRHPFATSRLASLVTSMSQSCHQGS